MRLHDQAPGHDWLAAHFAGSRHLEFQPLRSNAWLTEGIWRVTDGSGSVIVKRLSASQGPDADPWVRHWTSGREDQTHWNYWRREYLVYRSDIPKIFADCGIRTPALLHACEDDTAVTMFTQDCPGVPATLWGPADYYTAARNLGLAQGQLCRDGRFDIIPWLCVNYLADYALEKPFDRDLVNHEPAWEVLIGSGIISRADRDLYVRFARNEPQLLALLKSAPPTICHNDFWTNNLFRETEAGTTVIDWGFIGRGPMGSDLANMVASAGFDGFIASEDLIAFGDQALESYLDGLRRAGWPGDERQVRRSYWASAAKYAWVVPAMLASAVHPSHPVYVGYGYDGQFDFRRAASTLYMLAGWSDRVITS